MLALSHVTTLYNKTAQGFLFVVTVGGARLKYENFCQIVILPSEYNKNIWIQFTFNHTNTDTNTDTYGQTQTQTQTQTQPHKHKHRHIWSYGIYW